METLWVLTVVILGLSLDTCQAQADCPKKMDIALLIDTSKSMGTRQREKLGEIVYELIDTVGVSPDGNHIGVITFDIDSTVHNQLKDQTYHSEEALKALVNKAIMHEPGRKGWGTRTDIALHKAAFELFTENGGDRPDAKDVLLVLTDGELFIKKSERITNPLVPLSISTKALENKDVSITVIAIFADRSNSTKLALEETAGDKGKVIMHNNFDEVLSNFNEVLAALCPINGNYTEWTISECSVTCGEGFKTLTRTCTNPPPSNGGSDCSILGPAETTVPCNEQECPINGNYTEWTISECSVTCGEGFKTLTRTCTNPPPSNGGSDCSILGPAETTVPCNEQECPINGNYTEWTFSECSVTCGEGFKTLTRTCTNPPPSNGGKDCCNLGAAETTVPCNEQECPDCPKKMDIALLIDTSKSIGKKQRKKQRELVYRLIDTVGVSSDGIHYCIITFDIISTVHNQLKDQMYHSEEALKALVNKAIMHEPGRKGWGTRSDIALNQAVDEFTAIGGDRQDAKNVLLVLSDGKPFIKRSERKTNPLVPFSDSTKALENKDVSITVIGILADRSDKTKRAMEEMAGGKGKVIMHNNFDELLSHFAEMLAALCPVNGGYTELCNGQACDEKKRTISDTNLDVYDTNPDVYDTYTYADDTYPDAYDTYPDVYDTDSDFFDDIEKGEPIDPELKEWIV